LCKKDASGLFLSNFKGPSKHDPKIKEIHARNGGECFYQLSQIQGLEIIERFKQLPLVIEVFDYVTLQQDAFVLRKV
jgi:hypothetical protein